MLFQHRSCLHTICNSCFFLKFAICGMIPHLNHLTLPFLFNPARDPHTAQRAAARAGPDPGPPASSGFTSDPGGAFPCAAGRLG